MSPSAAPPNLKSMLVAGVMSGTSADGVDVALVRIGPGASARLPRIRLLGSRGFPYEPGLRRRILAAMDARSISVAELARLNWRLGAVYADAIARTCADLNIATPAQPLRSRPRLNLIGLHGQTLYHQATSSAYAGTPVRATWQTGEPAVVRERLGIPVVSDFRPADLAAGGQGAPLVPMLDFCLFRSSTRNRVLLNLGGIANVTVLPASAALEDLVAFDTGPANMVIDALMLKLYGRPYDRAGATAARGQAHLPTVETLLRHPYFSIPPPRSCGREQFGSRFAERLHELCRRARATPADTIATAAELTVQSIAQAFDRFCQPRFSQGPPHQSNPATEIIAAGGGTRNAWMMDRLTRVFAERNVKLVRADAFGIPAEAKEAVAFALLAWLSWHHLPGNVPSATGADRPVVLGRVTCA